MDDTLCGKIRGGKLFGETFPRGGGKLAEEQTAATFAYFSFKHFLHVGKGILSFFYGCTPSHH